MMMKNVKTRNADRIPEMLIKTVSFFAVLTIIFIFFFVFSKAWPVFRESGIEYFTTTGFDTQISEAFYASSDEPVLKFGMLGVIMGTLVSTVLSVAIATVLGVGSAIAIVELASKRISGVLTAIVRLLAAIASVVFRLIGIMTVVPLVEKLFITVDMQIEFIQYFQMTGRNLLSSVIVLTFMIVPMIISLSIDALKSVPNNQREVGFAFGMSHFRVIWKILLPAARSGITASIILATGRGIGEAIAVSMVCGGIGLVPNPGFGFASLLAPVLPLSAAIVNKSEAMSVASVESALFSCGAILLVFGAVLSIAARMVESHLRRKAGYR